MRILALCALVACGDPLRDGITPYDQLGYQAWKQTQVQGEAPGHAGYRTIYASPEAHDAAQSFTYGYQLGSILVKEVYNDAARTDLRHVAVMRRLEETSLDRGEDAGWYFTEAKAGGDEEHFDFCFRRCHVAAPYNGAWFDYRD